MIRRTLAIGALLGLAAAWPARSAAREDPPAPTPDEVAFSHADHVRRDWLESGQPEYARDCRGCHAYSAGPEPVDAPELASRCDRCHYDGNVKLAIRDAKPGEEARWKTLTAARTVATSFRHSEHLALTCRECHAPSSSADDPGGPSIPPHLPIPVGASSCVRCHGARVDADLPKLDLREPRQVVDVERMRTRFFARLNELGEDLVATSNGFGHADHLADAAARFSQAALLAKPGAATCTECHGVLLEDAATGSLPYAASVCGTCHLDRTGALPASVAPASRPSRTATTFRHADHLPASGQASSQSTLASKQTITDEGCAACHAYVPGVAGAPDSFAWVGGDARAAYRQEGCATCHVEPAWQVREHARWEERRCTECHEFDRRDMKEGRPQATVRRLREVTFKFGIQQHPGITTTGLANHPKIDGKELHADGCRECHRAQVDALPSRIDARRSPFDHDVHLGAELASEECAKCHVAATTSERPEELGKDRGDGLARTYELAECTHCHEASTPEEQGGETTARVVTAFPHATHVGKAWTDPAGVSSRLECVSCHDAATSFELPRSDRYRPIGTLEERLDCSTCHARDHALCRAGAIAGAEIDACASCHRPEGEEDSIPPIAATPIAIERLVPAFRGSQHHPEDRACAKCHRSVPPDLVPTESHFVATGPDRKRIHANEGQPPAGCAACHWNRRVKAQPPIDRPGLGNLLENYPGKDAKG